ncbi:CapA family protein [Qipengyuania marisflavi]|uniref:CapA family protein n=1 Tax=Qipengyuania marisflavi TaxID=2486356 RepID=A0A5S3P990_9SPHN|nr:CapA family protein [Qipengyuania marisflavi]TMM50079.1 CapA family protein [Qipengyuania marisflavi]
MRVFPTILARAATAGALLLAAIGAMPLAAHTDDALVGGEQLEPGQVRLAGALDARRDRVDLSGITVTVNGTQATLSRNGHFQADIARAASYRIAIDGAAIFRMVQTFGTAEVYAAACQCLAIPAIELVARKKGRIELFFGGDAMAGRRYFAPTDGGHVLLHPETAATDLDRLLALMKPYIESADLASINLETVLSHEPPGPMLPGKKIAFTSTPALAAALVRAGVDYVTLGNNHVYDFQEQGVAVTLAELQGAGLAYSGAGHDEVSAERAAPVDIGKQRLAMLGFVGWEGSGGAHQSATADKGGAALGTRGQIRRSTLAAKKNRRIPIVQYHGGAEYIDRPSDTTIGRLRAAIDNGAPIALGHHPHMTMGVEVYRGALVAPSIGNFMFDQEFLRTQVSYVVKAWLEKGRFIRAEIVPIALVDYRPVPATDRAREASLRRLFGLSAERGTRLEMSGGHAVVRPNAMRQIGPAAKCEPAVTDFRLANFAPLCSAAGRLGREVITRGDFELALSGTARERAFGAQNAAVDFAYVPGEGHHAELRADKADDFVAFYTQGYVRDVPAGDYTLSARLRLPRAARAELLLKDQPRRGDKPSARWRGVTVGTAQLAAGDGWQDVAFSFTREEQSAGMTRPFRPVLRIVWPDGTRELRPVAIDDFAMVSWGRPGTPADIAAAWRATHVQGDTVAAR